jgi:Circadian oscillating protein COP23
MKFSKFAQLSTTTLFVLQSPALFVNQTLAQQPDTSVRNTSILASKPAPTVAKPIPTVVAPAVTSPNMSTNTPPKKKVAKKIKLDKLAKKVKYNFSCVNGSTTALIGRTAKKQLSPAPMIVWTDAGSKEFGDKYSPTARCNEVTARFNQHFLKVSSAKGSALRLPAMRLGELNRMKVVCASNDTCTSSNLLWTLKKDNAKQGSIIISQLKDIINSKGKATSGPIFESEDNEDGVSLESDDVVEMEDVVATSITTKLESEEPELLAELESEDSEETAQLESDETNDTELESEDAPSPESEDAAAPESVEKTLNR